ncbi:MAG TPA: TIGR03435 family protein [Bryobacteraceae bacterium]|jgi:uncharacterized protein (TIGR03435 family)|nr:TIGR03435 family protein [Bryobacteraceae bacterium]
MRTLSRHTGAVATAVALGTGLSLLALAQQQTKNKDPLTFELAAIKPTPPETQGGIVHQLPGNQTYEAIGAPLRTIMTVAYTVTDRQISGGPEWINSDRWNIEAKADRRGTSDEMHAALARLLEERFHLKIRHETRELPVYLLTVDKQGMKMPVHDPADLVHEPFGGGPLRGIAGNNVTMNYLAFFLSRIADLNVLDRTELPDHYDVKFHFVPDMAPGGNAELERKGVRGPEGAAPVVMPEGPDLRTALREQLGLRFEKGRGPVDYLVIEHAEKPTDN